MQTSVYGTESGFDYAWKSIGQCTQDNRHYEFTGAEYGKVPDGLVDASLGIYFVKFGDSRHGHPATPCDVDHGAIDWSTLNIDGPMGSEIVVSTNSKSITGVHFKTDTGLPLGITDPYCGTTSTVSKPDFNTIMGGSGKFEINADHTWQAPCNQYFPASEN